jgi:hypothetical protein
MARECYSDCIMAGKGRLARADFVRREFSSDLILRSLAKQGVSKDGPNCCGLWPSFETPTSWAPQDEVSKGMQPQRLHIRRTHASSPQVKPRITSAESASDQ